MKVWTSALALALLLCPMNAWTSSCGEYRESGEQNVSLAWYNCGYVQNSSYRSLSLLVKRIAAVRKAWDMADPDIHLHVGFGSTRGLSITEQDPRPLLTIALSREELDESQSEILRLATLGKSALKKLNATAVLKDLGLKPMDAPGPVLLFETEPTALGYSLRSMVESNGTERLTLKGPKGLSVALPSVKGGVSANPAWSGDGRWLAYGSNHEVQVVELGTQRVIKIENPKKDGWPMGPLVGFSPRSTRLYAAWDTEARSSYDAFKLNLETLEVVPIEVSTRYQAEVWPEGLPRWGKVEFLDGEALGEEDL